MRAQCTDCETLNTTTAATVVLLIGEGSQSNMVFVPSKMGYLHVKNQGVGFRNWKKRWFVLKGRELICYKDGGHIENVSVLCFS
jgi:PH domain